jgi:transcriptional regulator with XRE-family HTH domain
MLLEAQNIRHILSGNVKFRRKILGISQEKLAELADLSAQTINDIEGCRMWVSDKTIAKLCRALHVDAYQLLLPYQKNNDLSTNLLDLLLSLQQNIKKDIDSQFEELFKLRSLS